MNPETLLKVISENPITSGIVASVLAGVVGFFKPTMRALQTALVRRIDQAWVDEGDEDNHDERIRKTADRVRSSTRFPLSHDFVEKHVRAQKSEAPPPL